MIQAAAVQHYMIGQGEKKIETTEGKQVVEEDGVHQKGYWRIAKLGYQKILSKNGSLGSRKLSVNYKEDIEEKY